MLEILEFIKDMFLIIFIIGIFETIVDKYEEWARKKVEDDSSSSNEN